MSEAEHYRQRLRDVMPYTQHKRECALSKWDVAEALQKHYGGANYSAGPQPPCDCGLAALGVTIWAEVGTNAEPVTR